MCNFDEMNRQCKVNNNMGLQIKQKDNKFNLTSSISGEQLHEKKWVSRKEAKRILAEREIQKMTENILKIDMDFPNGYTINGKRISNEGKGYQFNKWFGEKLENDDFEAINKRFDQAIQELEIQF